MARKLMMGGNYPQGPKAIESIQVSSHNLWSSGPVLKLIFLSPESPFSSIRRSESSIHDAMMAVLKESYRCLVKSFDCQQCNCNSKGPTMMVFL